MSEYIVEVRGPMHDVLNEEIVRCRDCKFYILDEFGEAECHQFTDYYSQPVHWPEPDGFCKWGERK